MALTEEQWAKWLADDAAIPCILIEMDVLVDNVLTPLHLSSQNYTAPDTGVPYLAVLDSGLPTTETLGIAGDASVNWGDSAYDNAGGQYDYALNWVWANREFKAYLGDVRWPRADFREEQVGVIEDIGSSQEDLLNIKLRDILKRLDYPLTEAELGGTTQNAKELIPVFLGECANVTPLLIDPFTVRYKLHDGPIQGLIEPRDNGIPVPTTDTDSTGEFVAVNQKPVGALTVSAKGGIYGGVYRDTIAGVIKNIVKYHGSPIYKLTDAELDLDNFAAFDTAYPYTIGYYASQRENTLQVCKAIAASINAFLLPTRAGKLGLFRLTIPTGTATRKITASDMADPFGLHIVERLPVRSGVAIGYAKNWTIQQDLKTQIPAENKKLFAEEFRIARAIDSTVATKYNDHSTPEVRPTYLIKRADAEAQAAYELNIIKRPRTIYEFDGLASCLDLVIGQQATLTHPRFGFINGRQVIITELRRNPFMRSVTVQFLAFD